MAFPHYLEKSIESGIYVWMFHLIHGVYNLTSGGGRVIHK